MGKILFCLTLLVLLRGSAYLWRYIFIWKARVGTMGLEVIPSDSILIFPVSFAFLYSEV